MDRFFCRIDKIENNDFDILARIICEKYQLETFIKSEIIQIGYEDFNAIIYTSHSRYVSKIFNNRRTDNDVQACIERTHKGLISGVPMPKIYKNDDNELLTIITINGSRFRIALLEYINGENFHRLQEKPDIKELNCIVNMVSTMSKIDYNPMWIYDEWALPNFGKEFEEKRDRLTTGQMALIQPIYEEFLIFDFDALPKTFVHGDITSTNIIKDINRKLWLVDFSVSNFMARIIEIIVISGDLALKTESKQLSEERIVHCFNLWCESVNATDFERQSFYYLFRVANAVNVMNTAIEMQKGNNSDENLMHMNQGLFGLSLFK